MIKHVERQQCPPTMIYQLPKHCLNLNQVQIGDRDPKKTLKEEDEIRFLEIKILGLTAHKKVILDGCSTIRT